MIAAHRLSCNDGPSTMLVFAVSHPLYACSPCSHQPALPSIASGNKHLLRTVHRSQPTVRTHFTITLHTCDSQYSYSPSQMPEATTIRLTVAVPLHNRIQSHTCHRLYQRLDCVPRLPALEPLHVTSLFATATLLSHVAAGSTRNNFKPRRLITSTAPFNQHAQQ